MMSEQRRVTQRQISSTAEANRREIHRLHPPTRLGCIGRNARGRPLKKLRIGTKIAASQAPHALVRPRH
jgi:hypothetical protein